MNTTSAALSYMYMYIYLSFSDLAALDLRLASLVFLKMTLVLYRSSLPFILPSSRSHQAQTTCWDHPKMTELYQALGERGDN